MNMRHPQPSHWKSRGALLGLASWLVSGAAFFLAGTISARAYDGIEQYETRSVEGWTVRVHRQ
jgi:hypothetical protein